MRVFVICLGLLAFAGCREGAQIVQAEPELITPDGPLLSGTPLDIRVVGLEAGQQVEVTLERVSNREELPVLYRSAAIFEATGDGTVSTQSSPALSGDYMGVNPGGLFNRLAKVEGASPPQQDFSQVDVKVDLDANMVPDLEDSFDLIVSRDDLIETPLGDDFPGAFTILPPNAENLPLIVTMGGSEGNDWGARDSGRRFASRGYATLGLPYYSPAWGGDQQIKGLPRAFAELDVDYLRRAVESVADQPEIDATRLGVYGVSKGAEYALLIGTEWDAIDAIAAIVPSDVVWEGWGAGKTVSSFSYQGVPYDFVPYEGMNEALSSPDRTLRAAHDDGRAAYPDRAEAARIPVETITAPVFVVGGDADTVWDSGGMARNILETRNRAGLETVAIIDPGAGHRLSGDGYRLGQEADTKVQQEAYPALLEFFEEHLK